MCLAAMATRKCLRRTVTGLAVLVLPISSPAYAQKPSPACKLLQPAEIEAALGGKAASTPTGFDDEADIAMYTCTVEIRKPGIDGPLVVTIQIVKNLPMDGRDAVRSRNRGLASEPQWKVVGGQFEEKTVGNAMCTRHGRPGVAAHSVCTIPGAHGYVEVDVQAPTQEAMASMDAVGALVRKAVTRL